MKKKDKKQTGKYAKTKTPEMIKNQKAAIRNYYINKRKEENKK